MNDLDICILGGGLSGMILALALAGRGYKSTVIEASSPHVPTNWYDNRTTAFTPASREFLFKLGVWEVIEQKAGRIRDIYVLDNKSDHMLHFGPEELGYIVPNSDLKVVLSHAAQNNPLITLLYATKYTNVVSEPGRCIITLSDGGMLRADLVMVCDGHNSMIKQKYFSNIINSPYDQTALTFNVWHEKAHEGTAVEHFMHNGPFAILPLASQNHSSIVWTLSTKQAEMFASLPKEELEYAVQNNFGEFLGQVKIDTPVAKFPLKACIAAKYFYQRIVLVGDTAHIVHPLAGQGLNQGIKDIECFTSLLHERKMIDAALLSEYHDTRAPDNLLMHRVTKSLNTIFSNDFYLLKKFRQLALEGIEHFAPLKNALVAYASGWR